MYILSIRSLNKYRSCSVPVHRRFDYLINYIVLNTHTNFNVRCSNRRGFPETRIIKTNNSCRTARERQTLETPRPTDRHTHKSIIIITHASIRSRRSTGSGPARHAPRARQYPHKSAARQTISRKQNKTDKKRVCVYAFFVCVLF